MVPSHRLTRCLLAIASGLALALAFPKFDFSLLAWVALVPLFYAIEEQSPLAVFGLAFLQGLVLFLGSLYWIVITLHVFADAPPLVAVGPMVLLAAVEALFIAVAVTSASFISDRLQIPILVTMPLAWVAQEWLRSFFPIGFPWNLLGYAAYRNIDLIQFAEFTGVYGVSALIVLFNAVLYEVLSARARRLTAPLWGLSVLTALMMGLLIFGTLRSNQLAHQEAAGTLRIGMVQGDIPQSIKWDPEFRPTSFKIYMDQTALAAREDADLIVWPEAAAAFFFQPDDRYPAALAVHAQYRSRLLELARTVKKPILFGAPALTVEQGKVYSFNRAYLVSPQGAVVDYYDKMELAPFAEYVPGRRVLGYFVDKVVVGLGDFLPGTRHTIFSVDGAKLGVLICYEGIFPDLARREVKAGANILLNITNDAWYGDSSAPFQLLAMSALRAVETHTPLVRVANTGISAVISPTGQINARTPLFSRVTEVETVGYRANRTVYTVVGDLFSEICFALTVVGLAAALLIRRPKPVRPFKPGLIGSNGHR